MAPRIIILFLMPVFLVAMEATKAPSSRAATFEQPSAIRVINGRVVIDSVFKLRSQTELQKLFNAGHILNKPGAKPPVVRPDISDSQKRAALGLARKRLLQAIQFFDNFPKGTLGYELDEPDKTKWLVHHQLGFSDGLKVISALGSLKDAGELLNQSMNMTDGDSAAQADQMVSAAVAILARTGANDKDIDRWIDLISNDSRSLAFQPFILGTASYGYKRPYNYLLEKIAVNRNEIGWSSTNTARALFILLSKQNEHVVELALDIVKAYSIFLDHKMKNEDTEIEVIGLNANWYFSIAYQYAATFAPPEKLHHLNLGFLPFGSLTQIARVFENPLDLVDHHYGVGRDEPSHINRHTHQTTVCESLAARSPDQKEVITNQMLEYFFSWYRHFETREHIAARLPNYIVGAARAHCEIDPIAVRTYDWSSNPNNPVYPNYIEIAAVPPSHFFKQYLAGDIRSMYHLERRLKRYTPSSLKKMSEEFKEDIDPMLASVIERKQIIADTADDNIAYKSGHDAQYFSMRPFSRPDSPPLMLAMRTTIALRKLKNRHFVGISFTTSTHTENGLAHTISGDLERLAEYTAENGRKMIASVSIRSDENSTEIPLLQTTKSGQHIFEIENETYSGGTIIDLIFDEALNLDPISVPIYATALAFEERFNGSD